MTDAYFTDFRGGNKEAIASTVDSTAASAASGEQRLRDQKRDWPPTTSAFRA
jgi:hypothetical protein